MNDLRLQRIWETVSSVDPVMGLLWLGLAAFTLSLVVLLWTRWGQYKPLRKCLALSLLAHLLLAGYSTTVEIAAGLPPGPEEEETAVAMFDGPVRDESQESPDEDSSKASEKPWERLAQEPSVEPQPLDPERMEPEKLPEPDRASPAESPLLASAPSLDHLPLGEAKPPEPQQPSMDIQIARASPADAVADIEPPKPQAQRREAPVPTMPEDLGPVRRPSVSVTPAPTRGGITDVPAAAMEPLVALPQVPDLFLDRSPAKAVEEVPEQLSSATQGNHGASGEGPSTGAATSGSRAPLPPVALLGERAMGVVSGAGSTGTKTNDQVPGTYQLRTAPNRADVAKKRGGTTDTEAAVKSALRWLAENQAHDGRWDASDHGAGRELNVLGRSRNNAGVEADTGMTGLALLAFLASGHTHREGQYRENVRRGLEYLLSIQGADGNLAGRADSFAAMYCHGIATIAMSEDYGMTRDQRLLEPVRRAVGYTVAAQHPTTGGWRYRPIDPGDTSQFGWQLMALKSAELAGIATPEKTRQGMIRYLGSVSGGQYGGLASYRPGEQLTRPMTAEALQSWLLLGMSRDHPAAAEAGDFLLGELPGSGKPNLYYWYYATLALYQLQDNRWQRWNDSLQSTLVSSQRKVGKWAGTWDPDDIWGGYGGRVYSTAMATLCLEVYYRYLPLSGKTAVAAK